MPLIKNSATLTDNTADIQQTTSQAKPRRLLLLGIGNILYGDEGAGVHFIHYIKEKYQFSHHDIELDIVDGGTLAHGLIPLLATYDDLIVVDTVNSHEAELGDVYFFDFDQAPADVDWQGSAHEVEMLQTLIMMEMVGDRPHTHVLGVIPTVIEPMLIGLTPQIKDSTAIMEKHLIQHFQSIGFEVTPTKTIMIEDVYEHGLSS